MGTVVYSMMIALGEMTTLFPVSGSFVGVSLSAPPKSTNLSSDVDALCYSVARPGSRFCPRLQLLVLVRNNSSHGNYGGSHRHFILGYQNQSRSVDYDLLGCHCFCQFVRRTQCLRCTISLIEIS